MFYFAEYKTSGKENSNEFGRQPFGFKSIVNGVESELYSVTIQHNN